jgi:PAS domain S-box-containing protein
MTGAAGSFVERQPLWEKFTGQTWEQHRGSGWTDAVHPDDRERIAELWRHSCETRTPYQSRGRLWHGPSQSWHHYVGRAVPLLNTDGSVREWVGCVADVHEQKMAEEATQRSEAHLNEELRAISRLQKLSAQLVQQGELKPLLEAILAAAADLTGTDKGNIQIYNPDTRMLRILVHQGLGWRLVEHFAEDGWVATCSQAASKTERVIVEDVELHHLRGTVELEIVIEDGIRSIQSTPLIGRDGRLLGMLNNHYRVPGRPNDQKLRYIDLLARQAADLLERSHAETALRDAHAQIADRAVHLEELVSERTAKLQEMIAELQHVSYAIVHDMRAPLRAMSTFADAILQDISSAQSTAQTLDFCRRKITAAARLDKLIQDSLSYTKAVLQDVPLQPVDLATLVRGLVETYPNLQPERAEIIFEDQLPVVLGEESLLTRCFSNLLGTAVKFVRKGVRPQIRIRCYNHGGTATITVEDNGIGISKQGRERLFGMFQRLTTEYEGTGIGLAVVRKVAERMGGKVGAESEPGKGSRFWVELRTATRPTEPAREASL